MKDKVEGNGSLSPDANANSGQEVRITPITLRELGMQLYKERVQEPEKPRDMGYCFASTTQVENEPFFPTVGVYFDPSWVDRNRTRLYLLKVNSAGSVRVGQHSLHNGLFSGVNYFRVYDLPFDRITDPKCTDDLKEIHAEEIYVAANIDDARQIDSWVANANVRERINDWFEARGDMEINKYVMLRKAPFNTSNVPGFGKYTYEGVVEEATKQFIRKYDPSVGKTVDKPVTFRMFTPEDVEWLNTFMKNKGLPIPNNS